MIMCSCAGMLTRSYVYMLALLYVPIDICVYAHVLMGAWTPRPHAGRLTPRGVVWGTIWRQKFFTISKLGE